MPGGDPSHLRGRRQRSHARPRSPGGMIQAQTLGSLGSAPARACDALVGALLANAGAQEIGLCEEADETAIAVYHRKVPHAVMLGHV